MEVPTPQGFRFCSLRSLGLLILLLLISSFWTVNAQTSNGLSQSDLDRISELLRSANVAALEPQQRDDYTSRPIEIIGTAGVTAGGYKAYKFTRNVEATDIERLLLQNGMSNASAKNLAPSFHRRVTGRAAGATAVLVMTASGVATLVNVFGNGELDVIATGAETPLQSFFRRYAWLLVIGGIGLLAAVAFAVLHARGVFR